MRVASSSQHECFGQLPEFLDSRLFPWILRDTEYAGQHADDIAVENGRRLIEGNAANCAGGVAAHAGQCDDGVEFFRKPATVVFDDLVRGLLQVAYTRVIAKTFPEFVQTGRTGFGSGVDGGQFTHPALPIRYDGFDLGLLEHYLGDPDCVRISSASPRQVARVFGEPRKQKRNESFALTGRE